MVVRVFLYKKNIAAEVFYLSHTCRLNYNLGHSSDVYVVYAMLQYF